MDLTKIGEAGVGLGVQPDLLAELVERALPHVPDARRAETRAFLRSVAASGVAGETGAVVLTADGWRMPVRLIAIPPSDADGHPCAALALVREACGQDVAEVVKKGAARIRETALRARDVLEDLRLAAGEPDAIRAAELEPVDIGALTAAVASRLAPGPLKLLVDFAVGESMASVDRPRLERGIEVKLREVLEAACAGGPVDVSVRPIAASIVIDVRYAGRQPSLSADVARADRASAEGPEPERRDAPAAPAAWTGLRYVDTVIRAHGGRMRLSGHPGSRVRLTLSLPCGGERPLTKEARIRA